MWLIDVVAVVGFIVSCLLVVFGFLVLFVVLIAYSIKDELDKEKNE